MNGINIRKLWNQFGSGRECHNLERSCVMRVWQLHDIDAKTHKTRSHSSLIIGDGFFWHVICAWCVFFGWFCFFFFVFSSFCLVWTAFPLEWRTWSILVRSHQMWSTICWIVCDSHVNVSQISMQWQMVLFHFMFIFEMTFDTFSVIRFIKCIFAVCVKTPVTPFSRMAYIFFFFFCRWFWCCYCYCYSCC